MNPYQDIFDRLAAAAPAIARSTPAERIDKLRRLYQATYDLRAEISAAGFEELGMDGKLHLIPLKGEIQYFCERLEGWMAREKVEPVPELMGRDAYVHYEPKGVVLHLATWNSPVLISLSPAISMIAAGNAIVIKPSEVAPQSAELVRGSSTRPGCRTKSPSSPAGRKRRRRCSNCRSTISAMSATTESGASSWRPRPSISPG